MTSVVIAAHNEAAVIGRCLDALLAGPTAQHLDVTVVPNGCTDSTAAVARARGVRVIEVGRAGKAEALNAGDAAAVGFPRIYLDADIVVNTADVDALSQALRAPWSPAQGAGERRALAAFPRRHLDLTGRPWLVRAYFAINNRLPAFQKGLFGRGMIALSAEGRARFDRFPNMVADDLFLDSLFAEDEKICLAEVVTTVAAPLRTRDLLMRLVRVRRGNAAMRNAARSSTLPIEVRAADRAAWLRDVVLPEPRLAAAGLAYVAITLVAALLANRSRHDDTTWQRDESTRSRAATCLDQPGAS